MPTSPFSFSKSNHSGFFHSWSRRGQSDNAGDVEAHHEILDRVATTPLSPHSAENIARGSPSSDASVIDHLLRPSLNSAATAVTIGELEPSERTISFPRKSIASIVSELSDSRSSISSRTWNLFSRSGVRVSGNATKDGQPPRPARRGYKWKIDSSGHWVEKKSKTSRRNLSHSATHADGSPGASDPLSRPSLVRSPGQSADGSESTSSIADSPPLGPENGKRFLPPVTKQFKRGSRLSEGLQWMSKHNISRRHRSSPSNEEPIRHKPSLSVASSSNKTDELSKAASLLRHIASRNSFKRNSSSGSSKSNSDASRKSSNRSHPTVRSWTSSIRDFKLGKPPQNTPNKDELYTARGSKSYFKVDLSDPNGPSYLPSEATRIPTPPLPTEDAASGNRYPSYFHDEKRMSSPQPSVPKPPGPPTTPKSQCSHHSSSASPPRQPGASHSPHSHRSSYGFLRPRLHHNSKSMPASIMSGYVKRPSYTQQLHLAEENLIENAIDVNIPDHLPSSPMCPKHPKHKSGGKGTCVYHGRN